MKERQGFVYLATCITNGKQYIGQTRAKELKTRWALHRSNVKLGSRLPFHRAIRKYGEDAFSLLVIWTGPLSKLDAAETRLIKKLCTMSPNGYNLATGGYGGGYGGLSKARRVAIGKKISIAHKGKVLTDEHRAALSAAQIKRFQKDPNPQKGKKRSEAFRAAARAGAAKRWAKREELIKASERSYAMFKKAGAHKKLSDGVKAAWRREEYRTKTTAAIRKAKGCL